MKFFTWKKSVIFCSLIFLTGVIMMQSCITYQPPPPLPDELKHIQFVYGWTITRELEQTCKSVRMEKVSRTPDWWAIHRRAFELKANVAQLVFDCVGYNCDVRFWACGATFLPDAKKDATKVFGDLIGSVSEVKGNEVTITGKNIAEKAQMGTIFAVEAGKNMVYIEVTFPMMTLAKCKVIKGSIKDVNTGMKVYTKPKKK